MSHDRSQWDFQDNLLSQLGDSSTHQELTKDLRFERDNNIYCILITYADERTIRLEWKVVISNSFEKIK